MIRSCLVTKSLSYIPIGERLSERLIFLQDKLHYKVINVIETTVNKSPGDNGQAFIIIYDNSPSDGKIRKVPKIKYRRKK